MESPAEPERGASGEQSRTFSIKMLVNRLGEFVDLEERFEGQLNEKQMNEDVVVVGCRSQIKTRQAKLKTTSRSSRASKLASSVVIMMQLMMLLISNVEAAARTKGEYRTLQLSSSC